MKRILKLTVPILFLLTLTGCPDIDKDVNLINGAITKLNDETGKPLVEQLKELNKTLGKLTSPEFKADLQKLVDHSLAMAKINGLCAFDIIKKNVIEDLTFKVAFIKFQVNPKKNKRPSFPSVHLCTISPENIDLNLTENSRKTIEIYGYGFQEFTYSIKPTISRDTIRYKGALKFDDNSVVEIPNTVYLTTSYHLSVNLTNIDFESYSKRPVEFCIFDDKGVFKKCIPILRKIVPCIESVINIPSHTIVVSADRWAHGDQDFCGNGPKVELSVALRYASTQKINIAWKLVATETNNPADTQFIGEDTYGFYNLPIEYADYDIIEVKEPTSMNHWYVDNNTQDDVYDLGQGNLIKKVTYVGDSPGGIFCGSPDHPKATIEFNPVQIRIKKVRSCDK